MVANTGTYLDTPFHRYPDGHDLAGLDLARVVDVPGVLVGRRAPTTAELLDGLDLAGAPCCSTPAGTATGAPTPTATRRTRTSPPTTAERLIDGRRRRRRHRLGEHRQHRHRRAPDPLRAARRRHPDRRAPHATSARSAAVPFRFTAAPPAVVGMGTFPVRAVAVARRLTRRGGSGVAGDGARWRRST